MSARLEAPPKVGGQTYLLSAGPRAGKTRCLQHWADVWGPGARYLKLSPPSSLGAGLSERLLVLFPEARASYTALTESFPRLSWGAALAFALEESLPGAVLLLDDWHLVERSPDEEGLLALVRHFPPQGTLAIASRHHFPPLGRDDVARWDAEHPAWLESPLPHDLKKLSASLVAAFLTLHLLGPLPASAESLELERLNLVRSTPEGTHALREAWHPVAEQLLASDERVEVWERLAEQLTAHYGQQLRTPFEARLREAWGRLPEAARAPHEAAWSEAPLPADEAGLRALLERPVRADRRAQHRQVRALAALDALAKARGDAPGAFATTERMVGLASRYGFVSDLLRAHVARLDARMLAAAPGGLEPFLEMPLEAFGERDGLNDFLRCLRDRAHLLGEPALAQRLETLWQHEFSAELPPPPVSRHPVGLRVRVFGPFALLGADGAELHTSRHKARLLFALLTLQPRGMFVDELLEVLFEGQKLSNPLESLHSITYAARRSLKAAGFEHLLECEGGCYRLRWQEVAFCDLHEFEAFTERALLLEARGLGEAAALMRAIAQAYVSGAPLEDLAAELPTHQAWLATRLDLGHGGPHAA